MNPAPADDRGIGMSWRGAAGFLLFWLVALAVGTAFVLVVLGGGFGWLALIALPAIALLLFAVSRARRDR
jgi:hypothetical protein